MNNPDTSPDARLAALFAAETPPARDIDFQAGVLAAVARRRFAADMMMLSTLVTLGSVCLWLLWPVLAPTLEALARGLAPGLAAVVVAASVLALTSGRALSPRS
jgi:hypothetical protein